MAETRGRISVETRGDMLVLGAAIDETAGLVDSVLIDAVANTRGLARLQPPETTCTECGAAMAFNAFPERYFSFLSV